MKKKAFAVASILLGSSSLTLGCAGHATVVVEPPPRVVVEGHVGGGAELIVQGAPPPPPAVQVEVTPPAPSPEHFWIAGYHRWDGHAYVWVPGRYERRPHPGAEWRAAHWEPRGAGHVWVEGTWGGEVAVATPAPQPAPVVVAAPAPTVEVVFEGTPPAPPAPVVEVVPPAPSPEHFWIAGYHRWDGHHYAWVAGRYERRPHPNAQWHAAHWEPRGHQHVWIEGSWDGNVGASANAKVEGGPPPAGGPAPAAGAVHPAYLHALSDLRNARANLEKKGGDKQMKWDEKDAIGAIDRAIHDIKEAAIDDGKPLQDHPAIDAKEPRNGRLHKALDALKTARADIDKEEDNAFAKGLRGRASHDIDEAIHHTEAGIQAAAAVQ
ncbi:MAG: hypothetical protein ACLQVI_19785 [Polyangiaceae bacterium]